MTVSVSDSNQVRTVCINRPESMNALNEQVLEEIQSGLNEITLSGNIRVVILTGTGDQAFCAGVDLFDMPISSEQDLHEYREGLRLFQDTIRAVRDCAVPVVAAVNGYALGAGCDLSLAADFRIAGENAAFGETFIDMGFVPGDGGTYLLPRLIGEANARELIYTGRHVGPEEAVDLGMARKVVPQEELREAATQYAAALADRATIALHHSKQLINESFETDFDTALEHATYAQRECSQTKDHKEAVTAFQEDRDPEFLGR